MISEYEVVLRLVLAAILGGLVGIEREAHNRPAGLRTHILVTVGSALIMLVSMHGFIGLGGDPARLAAQVVSGIGFLGAGTIMVQGSSIHGLTTAASLWVCGCIGLAIGNGYYLGGLITAGIVLFTLVSLGFFEKSMFKSKYKMLHIIGHERPGLIGEVGTTIGGCNIIIKHMELSTSENDEISGNLHLDVVLKIPYNFETEILFNSIRKIEGIKCVKWEEEAK
ncbi:MgtC/SapB family protein [Lutibacter sp. B2]|nr:MgtC/SapB family protein [Lutibacter sp. B2]